MPDDLDPAATLNPAMGSYKVLPTTSYKGPYGEVVSTERPPHRQFPMQAWGLQTGCWSSFGEYFPASGGVVKDPRDPTSQAGAVYIPPRNKAEGGVKKNLTSVVFGSDRVEKVSTYARDHSNPRLDANGNVTLQWAGKELDPDTGKNVSC